MAHSRRPTFVFGPSQDLTGGGVDGEKREFADGC
jgi:hypothetical protein